MRGGVSEFRRIAVLGPGLLGGSIALGVRRRHPGASVVLWGRNPERVAEIRSAGFEHATNDLRLAVQGAELVVLAVPVGVMEVLGQRILDAGLEREAFLTDVGSVKRHPHRTLGALMKREGRCFIGSHPMAGSERVGFGAASPDLFEGAPCILTNDDGRSDAEVNRLVAFWAGLGARVAIMDAGEHDRVVARISHVPHLLAVVCALVALDQEEDGNLAGGGLRDTSRVAGGDPLMWAEILGENRAEVLRPWRECIALMERLAGLLEAGEMDGLGVVLEDARRRRGLLDGPKP